MGECDVWKGQTAARCAQVQQAQMTMRESRPLRAVRSCNVDWVRHFRSCMPGGGGAEVVAGAQYVLDWQQRDRAAVVGDVHELALRDVERKAGR